MAANLINRISGLFHGDLAANRRPRRSRCSVAESLEQRRLLSAAPRVQSLSPVDIEARTSATWSLRFSEPVTGVDMTDFRVTPDVGVTWQSTVILCVAVPGSFSNLCGPRVLPCITKSRSLRILTGNNEGQFFPGQLIDLPNTIFAPVQVLLAGDVNKDITRLFDMDGDLNPDLITTNQDLGLCVYPGMGDGTFAAPIPVGFDGGDRVRINPFEIVITSDGDATSNLLLFSTAIDPVSGYQQDVTRVTLFQQNAAGQYQLASQLDVAGSVVPLKRTGLQSRLSSQHGLELRVSRYDKSTDQISILFQRLEISPTGQLSSSQILSLPGRIDQTADGDFDGDGITDTVFVGDSPYGSLDNTGITLLLRNPAQQSGDPVRATISRGEGAGNRPSALLATDIDGDSALDVLSVSQSTNTLNLSRGLGNGLFLPTQRISVGQGPIGVATLDFNHDGLQDAVTANSVDGTLTFLKNMGNGVLQRDSDLAVGAGRLANGDLNADGLPDLVVGSATQGSVHVLLGSSGGLQPGATLYSAGLHNLIVDDMNQDGIPDIPVMTENREVLISNGLGGGNFTPLN
ncbi:MAG: VCBS repeat-containing protein [Planctomyces sp.]|nr:VCBS repeat-containing protein [Planctomyces sp.]